MSDLSDLLQPVAVADDSSSLGQYSSNLSAGEPTVVRCTSEWRLLVPAAAVGHASTRLLVDLPLARVPTLPLRTPVAGAMEILDSSEGPGVLVLDGQAPVGWIPRSYLMAEVLACARAECRLQIELDQALRVADALVWRLPLPQGLEPAKVGDFLDRSGVELEGPAKAILGYDAVEFRNDPGLWHRNIHPDDFPAVKEHRRKVLKGAETVPVTYRWRHCSGDWVWLRENVHLIGPPDGPSAFLGFALDVTDREKCAAEESVLARIHEALAASPAAAVFDETIGRMLADVLGAEAVAVAFQRARGSLWRGRLLFVRPEAADTLQTLLRRLCGPEESDALPPELVRRAREAVESNRPLYSADLRESSAPADAAAADVGLCSALVQPLIVRDGFCGVLLAVSRRPDAFTASSRHILQTAAPALGASLQAQCLAQDLQEINAKLEERVRQRTFELEVLYDVAQRISTALNYDDLFRGIVSSLRRVLPHDLVITLVVSGDIRELLVYPRRMVPNEVRQKALQHLLRTYAHLRGEPLDLDSVRVVAAEERDWIEDPRQVERLESSFIVPLFCGPDRELVGLLLVAAEAPDAFTVEHVRLLNNVVLQASVSVERLRTLVAAHRRRLDSLVEGLPVGVALLRDDGSLRVHNPLALEYCGILAERADDGRIRSIGDISLDEICASAGRRTFETHKTVDGVPRIFQFLAGRATKEPDEKPAYVLVIRDITHERALEEEAALHDRLAAIGRLAGGVAHDFNNLLMVILGAADELETAIEPDSALCQDVQQIREAGQRAVSLTRQLLIFSRKQVEQPKILSLNDVVRNMEKMLRRVIREDIDLRIDLAPKLEKIKADPGHIEQVLMNLVVNARDAMPNGGVLTIATRDAEIDAEYVAAHPGARPGRYVLFTVSDTGVGMDEDTRRRAFEPFFTTKGEGEGTGLGLATVFGIVQGCNGYIWIDSTAGLGATFSIFFPVVDEPDEAPEKIESAVRKAAPGKQSAAAAHEVTVLVAEDDAAVRRVVVRALKRRGFNVVETRDGAEAIAYVEKTGDPIGLLVTDVVMPRAGGKDVAEAVHKRFPAASIIFMSGYTDDVIEQHEAFGPDTAFLPKPFQVHDLVTTVEKALAGPGLGNGAG
ncbi:MAG: response regulator [Kiritimatiellaeota bacterium]|nr:response regulator [Kiritimatiellota bacterium]